MKKIKGIICMCFAVFLIISSTGCGNLNGSNENINSTATNPTYVSENSNILVAYFSCSGTTETVAKEIAEETEADLFKIKPLKAYSEEDLDYGNAESRASVEQDDDNARPEIKNEVNNIQQYDTIILGYPIWFGKAPKIIWSFLESYDFTDKTIITFCTSGGSDIAGTGKDLESLCDKSTIFVEGKRFADSSEGEVEQWLETLGLDIEE